MAMFVILGGFTVIFRLFHTAMRYSSLIQAQQEKVRVAQNKLEEIRAWSRVNHQPIGATAFSDWSHWNGTQGWDTDYPAVQWKVEVSALSLASPCSLFENAETDTTRRRLMPSSCKQVTVTAFTGSETPVVGMGQRPVVLTTYIGQSSQDPTTVPCEVVVTGSAVTLARNATADYSVTLRTQGARYQILDVFFRWAMDPTVGPAVGNFSGPRDGRQTTIVNRIRIPQNGGTFLDVYCAPSDGAGRALCRYRGKTLTGQTPLIQMTGP